MVSKLQLAVLECCLKAIKDDESKETIGRLLEHYYEINAGIGVHKSPTLYGAFPTDPYSHTPAGKGAQQPGMTGQVKEDILSRFGELGIFISKGKLYFNPCILRKDEFLTVPKTFEYIDLFGKKQSIDIPAQAIAFTYCQVPIIYIISEEEKLTITDSKTNKNTVNGLSLDEVISKKIFNRTGEVVQIVAHIKKEHLK